MESIVNVIDRYEYAPKVENNKDEFERIIQNSQKAKFGG